MIMACKHAVPRMAEAGGGSIINVSSIDALRAGSSRNLPYAAAKGVMISATTVMAVHHGRDNIRGELYRARTPLRLISCPIFERRRSGNGGGLLDRSGQKELRGMSPGQPFFPRQ